MASLPERNDLCPCGSTLKYKKCYQAKSEKCEKFLSEQYQPNRQLIDEYFAQIISESVLVTNVLMKERSPTLSIIVLHFVTVEVFAQCWDIFLNKSDGNGDRMKEWFTTFALNEENLEFVNSRATWQHLTSSELYILRCSVLHFFALGIRTKNKYLCVVNGDPSSSNVQSLVDNYKRLEPGSTMIPIDVSQIVRLFGDGYKKTFEKFYHSNDKLAVHRLAKYIEEHGSVRMGI